MTIEDTKARESFLLKDIPGGSPKTKTFTYKKHGGCEQALEAAKKHMKMLQEQCERDANFESF